MTKAKIARDSGRNPRQAVAYYRTSSAANVGEDKDSLRRQKAAVEAYAKRARLDIVAGFYDAAVSGADPIDSRPGFRDLLQRITGNGVGVVLVESTDRFARDLIIQLTGHEMLQGMGVALVPVSAPDHFKEDTPTAVMVRQILGAVAQFEKASTVLKLAQARDRKRAETGRCEGRPPVPDDVVQLARKLHRKSAKTGKRPSLRAVARGLSEAGFNGPSGKPYGPESVKRMLGSVKR